MLLKTFADLSKAKAGEFYTPRSAVKLLVQILDPKPGETIYDPACGTAGMLIEAVPHMRNDERCCGAIFGQEKNPTNAAVARMNLFLHGANDFNIMCGDTLRDPRILQVPILFFHHNTVKDWLVPMVTSTVAYRESMHPRKENNSIILQNGQIAVRTTNQEKQL